MLCVCIRMIMKTASRALVWLSTTSKVCVGRVDGVWGVSDALERPSGPTAAERARGSSSERPPDAIDATRRVWR